MYTIYWLIDKEQNKTYLGFSKNLRQRLQEHKHKKVRSTKGFINFKCYVIEKTDTLKNARRKEKYWKSSAGRNKLKVMFNKSNK